MYARCIFHNKYTTYREIKRKAIIDKLNTASIEILVFQILDYGYFYSQDITISTSIYH